MACQCSSRKPPGCSRIETPAMLSEIGNSSTLASLAEPPAVTRPSEPSMSYLNPCNGAWCLCSCGSALSSRGIAKEAAATAAVEEATENNSRRLNLLSCWLALLLFIISSSSGSLKQRRMTPHFLLELPTEVEKCMKNQEKS